MKAGDRSRQFAARMMQRRREVGMSQSKLAALISESGISFHQPMVQRIESGDRAVTLDEAALIAQILGLNLFEFEAKSQPLSNPIRGASWIPGGRHEIA